MDGTMAISPAVSSLALAPAAATARSDTTHLERRGIVVLMSGITKEHHGRVFPGTPAAIAHARRLLASTVRWRRG